MGSNFRVFRDTEPFHEYLTHENLLSWVEFEQYRSKNEILTHENRISIKTRTLDTTKISRYTVKKISLASCKKWLHNDHLNECTAVFLISSYGAPLAHRASYLALHSSLFGPVAQLIMIILSLTALTLC